MSQESSPSIPDRKLMSPTAHVIAVLLTVVFFIYMMQVAHNHAPDVSANWKWYIAAFTSSCLSGVFWMAYVGFYVTLVDQMRQNAKS
jgi:hypothetical protein